MAERCIIAGVAALLSFAVLFTGCEAECGFPALVEAQFGQTGTFSSLNFPQDYSNNLDCRWKITAADRRHVIRLTVDVLDLEEESTCDDDSLSVYDADSLQSSRLLAKLCGIRNNAPDMYSTGRYMYIKFTTDGSITSQGFKLQYMAVSTSSSCGLSTYLHASFGQSKTMTSPNYPQNYFNNMDCGWQITADWNYVVRLHVTALDLAEESDCDFDSLSVYDADSEQDVHHLAKLCGRQNNLPYIYSTGPYMYIKFRTDRSRTRTGFQLQYTAARHSEIVPRTTTTSALWDTFTSSTSSAPYVSHHSAARIGGLTGAFALLFLFICCGWYLGMRSKKQRPPVARLSTAAPNPTPGSLVMYPNTSSADVLPGSQPNFNGNLNMAYSPSTNGPPPYFVPQHNFIQGTAAASCFPNIPATAPPTYDQAMMTSHPPSEGTSVDASALSVHMGTDLPPDAVAACPTSSPDQREPAPRSFPDSASSVEHGATSLASHDDMPAQPAEGAPPAYLAVDNISP